MRLLAISGSLRRSSYNTALLAAAAAECVSDVEFAPANGLADIPAYDEDVEQEPFPVTRLKEAIAAADAVIFATPEYNAPFPAPSRTRSIGYRAPSTRIPCETSRSP